MRKAPASYRRGSLREAHLNLLFDCHTFNVGPQGTTTFLAGLLNALPTSVAERSQSLDIHAAAHDQAAVMRFVDVPFTFHAVKGGFFRRNLVGLPQMMRAQNIDAVISQYVRPFRSRAPTVSVIHDVLFLDFPALFSWRYRFIRKVLFGWAARHSDVIITVSDYSRDRIAHHFGLAPDLIDVLPNAVEIHTSLPSHRGNAQDRRAPLRLLYVSRFETRKRQHWCVSAARKLALRGRAVELTLVGQADGPYADEVRAMIAADTLPGLAIAIRSDVSRDELDTLFTRTDLFLFPSQCEGFGIPVIEAAAHGVPCVVSANTAMIELADTYAGLAVETDDPSTFVDMVMQAVDRLPTLKEQAIVGAPAVRHAYRWSDVARRFLEILEKRGISA